ncbi:hypothetical protein SAY86_016225 [Trapa natans]|uniref:Uncharacterized protein n=1 Tax=Trapa natans TaxID=22666 RepID=A0AAN7LFP8_TRANT|nr:hypothetical protein SAY86_016225 [Trapa natans]
MIQEGTFLRGVSCLIFLVTLICSSMASWEEVPSQDILDLGSLEIGQDTVWKSHTPKFIDLVILHTLSNCWVIRVLFGMQINHDHLKISFPRLSMAFSYFFDTLCVMISYYCSSCYPNLAGGYRRSQ